MALTVTMSAMVARARRYAQMEGASAGAFCTDAEFEQWINDAARYLYDIIVKARGEDYYTQSVTRTTTAGTATYALPTTAAALDSYNFYRLVGLMATDGSDYCDIPPWKYREAGLLGAAFAGSSVRCNSIHDMRYQLEGANIRLRPAPGASGWTITIYYVPAMETIATGAATFDGINGWDELCVLSAAIMALKKEGTLDVAQAFEAERARIEARIRGMVDGRDSKQPDRIINTRRERRPLRRLSFDQ